MLLKLLTFIGVTVLMITSSCELFERKIHYSRLDNIDNNGDGIPKYRMNNELFSGVAFNNYVNGEKMWEFSFQQGHKHGDCIEYHENGEIYSEAFFDDGSKFGDNKFYNKDGQLINHVIYDENERISENRKYDENTGVLVSHYQYTYDGKPFFGERRYANGNKKYKAIYERGTLVREVAWFIDGQVEKDLKISPSGDRIHRKYFFDNGNPRVLEYFKDDKRHGEYKEFHGNGNIKRIGYFDKGARIGEFKVFYKNGSLRARADFDNDLISNVKYYDLEGNELDKVFPW